MKMQMQINEIYLYNLERDNDTRYTGCSYAVTAAAMTDDVDVDPVAVAPNVDAVAVAPDRSVNALQRSMHSSQSVPMPDANPKELPD